MEFLLRKDIDAQKWDARIESDSIENIFCYSWYLDAVAKNWGAFVVGDYESIFPVPFSKNFSVKSLYQPSFTRELDIFGSTIQWEDLLLRFPKIFRSIHFRNKEAGIFSRYDERKHQFIDLTSDLKFSTNANRLIKKADERFEYKLGKNPKGLMEIFVENVFNKIDSITNEDLGRLEQLMKNAMKHEKGELWEAYRNGSLVAGAFFLKDKSRITYLKGASTEDAKKAGVMYGLINLAIQEYHADYTMFDFGGSDVENVANFYKKFGATDRIYFNYNIDNLPKWYTTLHKLRQ